LMSSSTEIRTILIYYVINYILLFSLFWRNRKYLNSHASSMSTQTFEKSKSFERILIFQGISPWIFTGVPYIISLILATFDLAIPGFNTLILYMFVSVAGINPILFVFMAPKNIKVLASYFVKMKNVILCKKVVSLKIGTLKSRPTGH
uniref:G_PROTEIN_RECEP_F1_2 domain-containing protein n=1 Tax=Rhabditophanes sp. KR3021 TaxID=114890 RepID=A0AC35TLA0_9BILA